MARGSPFQTIKLRGKKNTVVMEVSFSPDCTRTFYYDVWCSAARTILIIQEIVFVHRHDILFWTQGLCTYNVQVKAKCLRGCVSCRKWVQQTCERLSQYMSSEEVYIDRSVLGHLNAFHFMKVTCTRNQLRMSWNYWKLILNSIEFWPWQFYKMTDAIGLSHGIRHR